MDAIRRELGLDLEAGRDALQEVALRFLSCPQEISSPEGWVLVAYRNECLRHIGKRKASGARNLAYLQARALSGRFAHISREILANQVVAAIERLRTRDQKLIRGRYFEELSLRELAERIGVSPSSIKKVLSRALGRLRRFLRVGHPAGVPAVRSTADPASLSEDFSSLEPEEEGPERQGASAHPSSSRGDLAAAPSARACSCPRALKRADPA